MDNQIQNTPGDQSLEMLLTRAELENMLKISGRTISRLVASGNLPAPLYVGRSCRWRTGDIVSFIEKMAESQLSVR